MPFSGVVRKWAVVGVAVVVTVFAGFHAFNVPQRGPLDHVLLDEDNPTYQANRYVASLTGHGFTPTEGVILYQSSQDPNTILKFEERARSFFGENTVLGLTNIRNLHLRNEADGSQTIANMEPYVYPGATDITRFADDPIISSFVVGKEGTMAVYFPPHGHAGLEAGRRVEEFLSGGVNTSWWDLDIHAKDGIVATGMMMVRYIMQRTITYSSIALMILGTICILFPVFVVSFGVRHAVIATILMWTAFVWQRGMMGWLGVSESVYSPIALAAMYLAGTSAFQRIFDGTKRSTVWTVGAGGLIGFLSLMSWMPGGFQVTHVSELAWWSITGIVSMLIASTVVFPLFIDSTARNATSRYTRWMEKIGSAPFRLMRRLVTSKHFSFKSAVGTLLVFIGFAVMVTFVYDGRISTATDPMVYIKGYMPERGMNVVGPHIGSTSIDVLVETKTGSFEDGSILWTTVAWMDEVRTAPGIVAMNGPATAIRRAAEVYLGEMPRGQGTGGAVAQGIVSSLQGFESQFFLFKDGTLKGMRVILGVSQVTDQDVAELLRKLKNLSAGYPALKVTFFNESVAFAELPPYVTQAKVWNAISSNGMVMVFLCICCFMWQQGKEARMHISPLRGGIIIMLPFCLSFTVFLFCTWVLGRPLDVATVSISALAIAASADQQAYILYRLCKNTAPGIAAVEETLREEGVAIVKDAMLAISVTLLLFFAPVVPVQELGLATITIIALCLLATFVCSPLLVFSLLKKEREYFIMPQPVVQH